VSVSQPTTAQCNAYCANITLTCTGGLAQYPNPDSFSLCTSSCVSFPDNATLDPTAMTGDTYQCRIYHLGAAQTDANTHCKHAGFNGGPNVCGTFCSAYCDNIMTACVGANAVFLTRDSCMKECSYYPVNSAFNLSSPAIPKDNSVDCRAWHSQVAVTTSPSAHCTHAAPQGGGFCGTACENYCNTILAACPTSGNLKQWNSFAQCNTTCYAYPGQTDINDPTAPVTAGDLLPCRKYHAGVAGDAGPADVHCPHAGPLGGGVCGTPCEAYCDLRQLACGASATCMTECAAFDPIDFTTVLSKDILAGGAKVKPNSVGCAAHYAIKAFSNPTTYCPKAVSATGDECGSAAGLKASWAILALILLALGFNA